MKKRFNVGIACKKTMCRCNELEDAEFDISDEFPTPSKHIAKYIPPLHKGCDCVLVDTEDNGMAKLEKVNEERKAGGEIGLYGIDAIGVMVRRGIEEEIYQVVLDKEEETKVLEYIRYLHDGMIKCFSVPMMGVNLLSEEVET